MLAVTPFPHEFGAALASEASIVPGAPHHRVTPVACPGRVPRAEPRVGSRRIGPNSYACSLVSHAPLRTGHASFRCTQLSSDYTSMMRLRGGLPACIATWQAE